MIENCKLPKTVLRRDFNIKKISRWKASEYKNFFFYIAVPVFDKFLKKDMLLNLYLLVAGNFKWNFFFLNESIFLL